MDKQMCAGLNFLNNLLIMTTLVDNTQ